MGALMFIRATAPLFSSHRVVRKPSQDFKALPQPRLTFAGKTQKIFPHILNRKNFFVASATTVGAIGLTGIVFPPALALYGVALPLIGVGVYDAFQKEHSLRYNYPLTSRIRWIAEAIRPELRQYFWESDTEGAPLTKEQRDKINERAKEDVMTSPFGTKRNLYAVGAEALLHSIGALSPQEVHPRILIGGPDCKKPYAASIFNISAMSYGGLSKNAVLALNKGAKMGGFYHNTGEGSISPFHLGVDVDMKDESFDYNAFLDEFLKPGSEKLKDVGDLVWQIGTGYFGCRKHDGTFDFQEYARKASLDCVKMIELKLSQGAKPGHGGVLPAKKVTPFIAKLRGVPLGQDVISPPAHSAFSTPRELLHFIKQLRDLSGGKPVGFKLCVGNRHEFLAICKAMLQEKIYPDFITIDGSEGGTGAAPREFADSVGVPLDEGLLFVHNSLVGTGLRDKIKLIASGKIVDGYDIISKLARGADLCNSARGMMVSIGCIQAKECNTNTCPTGVATQDPELVKGLDPEKKGNRNYNYHHETIIAFIELIAAAGLKDPSEVKPWNVEKRVASAQLKLLDEIYEYLQPSALLQKRVPKSFKRAWQAANPDSFKPQAG